MKRVAANSFILIFIWFGSIAAISFMEAPVKFTAPSLSLPVGLDVGRTVFSALNKVEISFALLTIIFIFVSYTDKKIVFTFSMVLVILLLQTFWLLPSLDERAHVIINGGIPQASNAHIIYVILEVIKLAGLFVLGLFQVNYFKNFTKGSFKNAQA